MIKGWHLVSLYTAADISPEKPVYVSFAHYTGKQAPGGGAEYDKNLQGYISYEDFRKALRKHLVMEPGNNK